MMNIEKTIKNLELRGFSVKHFEKGEEAAQYLSSQIQNTEVGIGGCMTAQEINLFDILSEKNTVHWHWKEKGFDVLYAENASPVFITGANAITEQGEIINIDGRGNRLAGQVFGIDKMVYVVSSTSKICEDFESAVTRARQVAAVTNGKRFPYDTPCKKDGKCHDCRHPERFCNAMLVLWGPLFNMKGIEVILIDEELGY